MPVLPFLYNQFTGGLNSRSATVLIAPDTESRDCQNVQGTTDGAAVKRTGLVTLATPPVVLTSLWPFELSAFYLIGAGGTSLYSISPSGAVVTLKTGLTDNTRWVWQQTQAVAAQGPLYGMNGVDPPQQWDGVAAGTSAWTATTGTVPNGKYMLLAGNRLWVTGVATAPSRVYFSDLIPVNNGPVTWPAANVSVFDEADGEPITGLEHVGPYILVTKARKLYVIYDFNTGDARRLSDSIGAIAPRSLVSSPQGTFFLSEDRGVYLTNGSKVTPISDNIQPTLDSTVPAQRANACGQYFNGHYYLSICRSGSTNDTTLDYDTVLSSWWLHTFGSNQFATWHSAGVAGLYSAKSSAAIIDRCFVPGVHTDNGTPFLWRWAAPWQSPTFYRRRRFPTPYFAKRVRQVRVGGSGTIDVSLAQNFVPAETLKASNLLGGAATLTEGRLFSLGVFETAISLVFSSTSTTDDHLNYFVLMVTDRRDLVQT